MRESLIQKQCIEYLNLKRIFNYRQNTGAYKTERGGFVKYGTAGSPDIVAVIKGQYVGIEIKNEKGKQNANQKAFQKALEKAGGKYLLIRSLEELILQI